MPKRFGAFVSYILAAPCDFVGLLKMELLEQVIHTTDEPEGLQVAVYGANLMDMTVSLRSSRIMCYRSHSICAEQPIFANNLRLYKSRAAAGSIYHAGSQGPRNAWNCGDFQTPLSNILHP